MKKLLSIALLTSAFVLPSVLLAADNVRFPPIDQSKWNAQQQEFSRLMTSAGQRAGGITNAPFKVYFASPEFGLEAIKMSNYLRWGTGLDARLAELAILIAGRNWTSDYIWHAHYPLAIKGGLDPSVAADMAVGKRPTKMKEDEAIIYDLLTEIYRDHAVSDATYAKARAKYGEKGISDIVGLGSYYGVTAMAIIVSNTETAPGDEPKLQRIAQVFPK
jgi:4-carboxymuconolactone decarboxylase